MVQKIRINLVRILSLGTMDGRTEMMVSTFSIPMIQRDLIIILAGLKRVSGYTIQSKLVHLVSINFLFEYQAQVAKMN